MALVEEQIPLRLVGKRAKRADAPERLTGQVRYTADLALPGLLHARLVRSPHASARIVSVDKSEALRMPGVVSVLTAEDLPVQDIREAVDNRSIVMALDRVVYAGQPVAVVLAETEAAAEDGAQAVEVEFEAQDATVDPLHALDPDSPVVRNRNAKNDEELGMHGAAAGGSEAEQPQAPNVASHQRYHRGDMDKAFEQADLIVEREYRTPWVHQSYMEPQVCAATTDPLGNVVVYACTQAMFRTRDTVAAVLGKSPRQVRVYAMPVGGGFGGKFGLIEPLTAALAVAAQRPVLLAFTRVEEFGASNPAPSSIFRVKAGVKSDGTFVALKGDVIFDAGAKPGAPAAHAALCLAVFYRWPNIDIDATEVVTHKTPTGAYRAPGLPQAMFASESLVDEIAEKLHMDPIELRKKNVAHEGDTRPDGTPWPPIGLEQCLDRAASVYKEELAAAGPNEGVGVALGGWFGGVEPSSALCRLESDGTLQVAIGAVDLTGTNAGFQVIAAEAFGFESVDKVRVTTVDTDSAPYSGATGGSKTMYTMGPSVMKAAQEARERVLKIAAADMEAAVDDLELVNGEVRVKGVPDKVRTLRDIYKLSASFGAKYEPVVGKGEAAIVQRSPGTGVHIARVRVDPELGRIQPLRYVVVQDVGKAINPALVEAQIHGGGAQGVGWGMYEEIVHDDSGTPITASLMDYTIPKASQLPELQAILVEVPSKIGPFGAKPVGEPPIIPGGAVIANAVHAATGARVTELPLSSERVRKALETNGTNGQNGQYS
ncbi:MAG: xanthine dehydrogenase family protein molybdopterin-binding subunit [Chloroflexi bacterium]|nr:xanthine dehydrogenase family protein molybdopterin-binding subunit [Chloroflexota bacterium]